MKKIYELSIFETMRSYHGRIVYFHQHLKRLEKSAELIGMKFPYSLQKIKGMITRTIRINKFKDAYVKLILLGAVNKTDVIIIVKKYQPYLLKKYTKGFSAAISQFRQRDIFLAQIKTTNRSLYERAFNQAKAIGFDEAIILNKQGNITEGTRSNIFFAKNNTLFTPALECGCLAGITRQAVLDLAKKSKIKVNQCKFSLQELYQADEAFLTNSLMGVMPLKKVERKKIGKANFKLTRFFMQKYNHLLHAN